LSLRNNSIMAFQSNLKLSIIVPIYNGEKYLSRCLDSLLNNQGLSQQEYEIICVNDNSPDNSCLVIESYQKLYSNIVLINHIINKRQGGAKNTGIRKANGKFILFVDQDDFIKSHSLSILYNIANNNNLDLLSCRYYLQNQDGMFIKHGYHHIAFTKIFSGKSFLNLYFQPDISLRPWALVYRKDYLLKINIPFTEHVLWEDSDWVAQITYSALKIMSIPHAFYYWNQTPGSITNTLSGKTSADWIKMANRKLQFATSIIDDAPALSQKLREDAIWNARAVKNVLKMNAKNRRIFYHELQKQSYQDIKNITNNPRQALYKHPHITHLVMFFLFPIIKSLKK